MNTSRGGSLAGPGDTLSTTNGTWNYGVTTYSYVWQDCTAAAVCTNITGATSQTYPVVSADAGYYVQSIVTATNAAGVRNADQPQPDIGPHLTGQFLGADDHRRQRQYGRRGHPSR
jgi:hypothetical protein